jgi:ribosomal protection tetracycline resistance protein
VTDCVVTMTHSGYWARQSHAHGTFDASMSSTAGDFRNLTPLVLMSALVQAGTVVQEPIHHFRLEVPVQAAATILPVLARLRGVPRSTLTQDASCLLEGDIPAARVHDLQQLLPGLAGGAGLLDCGFDRYQPVRGTVPIRPRSGSNPLSRSEYLVQVAHRMAGH